MKLERLKELAGMERLNESAGMVIRTSKKIDPENAFHDLIEDLKYFRDHYAIDPEDKFPGSEVVKDFNAILKRYQLYSRRRSKTGWPISNHWRSHSD